MSMPVPDGAEGVSAINKTAGYLRRAERGFKQNPMSPPPEGFQLVTVKFGSAVFF